jgi:hypothetical protein
MWTADDTRLAGDLGRSNGSAPIVLLPVDHEDVQSTEHLARLEAAVTSLIGASLAKKGSRRRVHHDQFRAALMQAANTAIRHYLKTVRAQNAPPAQPKPSLHGFEPGDRTR